MDAMVAGVQQINNMAQTVNDLARKNKDSIVNCLQNRIHIL